jgi:hypothetical protein
MNQYDYLKDKLQDYQVKADKDKIWKATAHAIPQRRRRVMLFLFCLGSLAGLGLLGYELSFPSPITSFAMENNQPGMVVPSEHHTPGSTQAVIFQQPGNQTTNEALLESAALSSTTTKTKSIISNQFGEPQKTNLHSNAKTTAHPAESKSNLVVHALTIADQSTTNTPLDRVHTDQNNNVILHSNADDGTGKRETGSIEATSLTHSISKDHKRSIMDATDALSTEDNVIADALQSVVLSNPGVPVIPANRTRKPIVFSAMAAIGISTLDIKALNSETEETTALFNQSGRSLEHLSVDFAGTFPLSDLVFVEAKLGWNQWTIETQQQVTTHEPITRESIAEVIIDEQGVQHPVMGMVNGIQVTNTQMVRYTQFQTIAANFSLHAELWHHHRTSIDAYLAGSVKLYDNINGSAYNSEGVLARFTKDSNPFKRTSAVSYGGGLQLNYKINPHVQVNGSLGYQPVSYLWRQDQQQIRLTHSRIRGNLGLIYQL